MTKPADELARRESAARQAIQTDFDMENEDSAVAMFVAFHLEELEGRYWQQHMGTARPDPSAVPDILVLREHWGEEDDMEFFDFALPGGVSDYVISVHFDHSGKVDDISMES